MKLAYLGTPSVAVPPLVALHDAGFEIPIVVTNPDKRRGRGSTLHPTPVKAAALDLGLTVTDRVDDVLDHDVDLGVVVAYGHLIRPHILERVPMVNLHFSLLPRWRGAAPVERAILAGDTETGVCLMELEEGLDTGAVYRRAVVPIGPTDTLDTLRDELVRVGSDLLVAALTEGLGEPVPQEGEPVYASKIRPEERHLDLSRPADEVDRVIRLGRAWTEHDGKRLRILQAEVSSESVGAGELVLTPDEVLLGCGAGSLSLLEVQPEGKAPMAASAWRNGL
jgi:methionyl-tRNA formyltransferase